jgi:hypothetical protein
VIFGIAPTRYRALRWINGFMSSTTAQVVGPAAGQRFFAGRATQLFWLKLSRWLIWLKLRRRQWRSVVVVVQHFSVYNRRCDAHRSFQS